MNYLSIILTLRNLLKNKISAFLKLLSVFLGISIALILFLYVQHEKSFDKFYPNYSNIYRLSNSYSSPNGPGWSGATVSPPVARVIHQNFPQIDATTRLYRDSELVFSFNDMTFEEDNVYYADSSFFDVFNIPLTIGNPKECLKVRNTAVLSKSIAEKYFNTTDCIGKTLKIENREEVQVTGVFEDLPSSSSLDLDILLSWSSPNFVSVKNDDNWNLLFVLTFLKISQPINCKDFSLLVTNILESSRPKKEQDMPRNYYVEPLEDVYLNSQFTSGAQKSGNLKLVSILFASGLILIFLGWINYINISTAVSIKRQKEIGVLKYFGAKKSQLLILFSVEAIVLNFLAIILALAFTALLLPQINQLLNIDIALGVLNTSFYIWFIPLLICGTLIIAIYESSVLSALNSPFILKPLGGKSKNGKVLKRSLLAFQYVSCILMIFFTLVIYAQTRHLIQKDIGLKSSDVLVLKGLSIKGYQKNVFARLESFKNELMTIPEVKSVTSSNTVPANYSFIDGVHRPGQENEKSVNHTIIQGDYKFLDTYEVDIIAGKDFYEKTTSNTDKALISENSAKLLGFSQPQDAVGKTIVRDFLSREYEVLGVFQDFRLGNKFLETYPIVIYHQPQEARFISVSYNTSAPLNLHKKINEKWNSFFPDLHLRYFYLDQSYNAFYTEEISQQKIFILFSLSSILINCLGLLALALYTLERRTKEIGVRKVNGAGLRNVLLLIFKEYFVLILLSSAMALPLAFVISQHWLKDYGQKIIIGLPFYLLPVIIVTSISILTIFYHSLKVARKNPVHSLRHE